MNHDDIIPTMATLVREVLEELRGIRAELTRIRQSAGPSYTVQQDRYHVPPPWGPQESAPVVAPDFTFVQHAHPYD